jgi:hypothetical protein
MKTIYRGNEVEVLEKGNLLSRVKQVGSEDYTAVWVLNRDLKTEESKSASKRVAAQTTAHKFSDVPVLVIDGALVQFVKRLRLVYPEKAQGYLNEQASKHGFILDPRTRAVRSGLRGGTTVQRTVAATVELAPNTPGSLLPDGYITLPKGGYRVNRLAVAFALLKAGAKQTAFA